MKTETKKENEVFEIEILTQEQIDALELEISDDIVFLTDNMNSKKLAALNPVFLELQKLKERVFSLALIPADDKGKYEKSNIQEYKDMKADTRSFNSKIKAVAKEMKDPLNKTKSHIINIEKEALKSAAEILEAIDLEFEPYVADEQRKAEIAKKKKDDALNAKVLEAEAETKKVLDQAKKVEVLNKVKYELIAEKITNATSNHIANSNLKNIEEHSTYVNTITFDKLVAEQDVLLLDEDVLKELMTSFDVAIKNAKANIETRIKALETEVRNQVLEAKEVERNTPQPEMPARDFSLYSGPTIGLGNHKGHEGSVLPNVPVKIDEIPSVNTKVEEQILNDIAMMNGFEFADYCTNQIKFILELIDKEIANGNDCSPKVYQIKSIINPIKEIE